MSASEGEVKGVHLGSVGVSSEDDWALLSDQPLGELNGLLNLDELPVHARWGMVRGEGKDPAVESHASRQRSLWEVRRAGGQDLRFGRSRSANGHTKPPTRLAIESTPVEGGAQPVESGGLPKRIDGRRIDLLKEDEVRAWFERSEELAKAASGVTDPVADIPGNHPHTSKVILAATA